MISAVLFDLDGTLADTAADLGAALNHVRMEEGLQALPAATIRPQVSNGVRGLLKVGFGLAATDAAYADLSQRLLAHYSVNLCVGTRLFDGIAALLDALDQRRIAWGIVTNKGSRYTVPLIAALGLASRAACVISGDSAAKPKPAPDPLLMASAQIGIAPTHCHYVGDDLRDIQAGRAAGMHTVAAAWGYLGDGPPLEAWGADTIIHSPAEVLSLIEC